MNNPIEKYKINNVVNHSTMSTYIYMYICMHVCTLDEEKNGYVARDQLLYEL